MVEMETDNMKTIYYNENEYNKMYDHEGGGTYFVSKTSNVVTSWLDVYPDGKVKYLWNGILHDLGMLEGNRVMECR